MNTGERSGEDSNRELTSDEVAALLPTHLQERLGHHLWVEDSHTAAVAVSVVSDDDLGLLQEYGIIQTGDPEEPFGESQVIWTEFGTDVSFACQQFLQE